MKDMEKFGYSGEDGYVRMKYVAMSRHPVSVSFFEKTMTLVVQLTHHPVDVTRYAMDGHGTDPQIGYSISAATLALQRKTGIELTPQ